MKIKNAVCYSFSLGSMDADPMGHLRIAAPFRQAGIRIVPGVENGQVFIDRVSEGDIIVFQREVPRRFDDYQKIVDLARREGKPVVFELDDLLFFLPENHPDRLARLYTHSLLPMFQALLDADMVTVSTPKLRSVLENYHNNVVVLSNYFDDTLWQLKPPVLKSKDEVLTIGYMGGNSHKPDLEYVTPVLLDLIERYPQKIRFHFWGIQPPEEMRSLPEAEWTSHYFYLYKDFSTFFQAQSADIFIAPLVDNLFNRCKSPLKFFEYSALGTPGVFSHLDTYSNVVTHGQNGLLAASLEEWSKCLIQLIENNELRFHLATNAQATIRENWLLSQNAFRWREAFQNLVDAPLSQPSRSRDNIVQSINTQLFETFTTLAEKEQTVQTLSAQVAEKEQAVQTLSAQVAEKEQSVQALNARLWEIFGSRAWRLIQLLWHVRTRLIPHGSRRERFVRAMRQQPRRFRQRPVAESNSYDKWIAANEPSLSALKAQHTRANDFGFKPLKTSELDSVMNDRLDKLDIYAANNEFRAAEVRGGRRWPQFVIKDRRPGLSVVILNLNKPELIMPLVEHLRRQQELFRRNGLTLEIVVGDTGSTVPETLVHLRELQQAPDCDVLFGLQYHFSRCNNHLAFAHSSCEMLLFLNNDIIFARDTALLELCQAMERRPDVGVFGALLFFPDGTVQHAGVDFFRKPELRGLSYHPLSRARMTEKSFPEHIEVPAATGAFLAIRAGLFQEIGGFEEEYAAECQDIAICLASWRHGFSVQTLNLGATVHLENATRPKNEENWADRQRFLRKWGSFIEAMFL
jgi:GT2 family glycosyltransferase/glycosyltransferase involved in cell wall biosynthesis